MPGADGGVGHVVYRNENKRGFLFRGQPPSTNLPKHIDYAVVQEDGLALRGIPLQLEEGSIDQPSREISTTGGVRL
jgi:hypothetical protein